VQSPEGVQVLHGQRVAELRFSGRAVRVVREVSGRRVLPVQGQVQVRQHGIPLGQVSGPRQNVPADEGRGTVLW